MLLFASPALAQTTTVQLQDGLLPTPSFKGTADTIIKQQTPTLNLGEIPRLRVTTSDLGGGATWSLVRWDISGFVPPGCVVTEARIRLYVDPDDPGPASPIYELLKPWTESGATWSSTGTVNWQSGGAGGATDRGSTLLGNLPGSSGFQEVTLNAAGVAMVQRWADDPSTNNGVILLGVSSDGVNFGSRDDADATLRPRLQVSYTLPSFGGAGVGGTVTFRQGQGGYTGATDTWLDSNSTGTSHGNTTDMRSESSPRRTPLVRWDLSGLPTGVTVTDAEIELTISNTGNHNPTIYQLDQAWTESATWLTSNGSNAWPGGVAGRGAESSYSTNMGTMPGSGTTVTATLNAAGRGVVQDWINGLAPNYGVMLRGNGGNDVRYRTSEHGTVSQRPQLTITYTVPGSGGTTRSAVADGAWDAPATWSGGAVPGPDDRAVIAGFAVTLSSGVSSTIKRLEVQSSGSLTVSNGTITVTDLTAVQAGSLLSLSGTGVVRGLGRTLAIAGGELRLAGGGALRLGALPCWVGGGSKLTASGGGTLSADVPATPMSVSLHGTLSLDGLTVTNPNAAGLQISRYATLSALRRCSFQGIAAGAGARLLSIEQDSLALNAPGNVFAAVGAGQFSARLVDTDASTGDDVALNLESRGAATNGAGAGPAFEQEVSGAAINWVHSAPDSTRGTGVGFAQVAYDLNTFAYYATYVAFQDVNGPGTPDRIHVFDPNGEGIDQGFWFEIPQSAGDLVGGFWWDQRGSSRVVWAVTTTGRVFRFTNPGAGAGAIAPDAGFPVTVTDGGAVVFSVPPLTADASLVYTAGTAGGSPRFFALDAATGALAWSAPIPPAPDNGLSDPITSHLGSESLGGVTRVYAGGGQILDPGSTIFSQSFNGGSAGTFSYLDDAFRGTSSPGQASGDYAAMGGVTGGRVRVSLGPLSTNMSGAWVSNFTVPTSSLVGVTFAYRLITNQNFEFDEHQQVLCSIDGVLQGSAPNDYVFQLIGDGNGGGDMDSGWRTATFRLPLGAGSHELRLGGFINKSTEAAETAQMLFDDVQIYTVDTTGRIFRINTQTRLVDLEDGTPTGPITGSVLPAYGLGLFAVDQNGALHGIDPTTMTPLSGWPVQTTTPLASDVWLDYWTGDVFFGSESGALFGYALSGAPLPGWPLANPFGAGAPVRESALFDSGLLWAVSSSGRFVAVDVSTATVLTTVPGLPDYRFGGGTGRVSQDSAARPTLVTSRGQYVVTDTRTDPTP
ncbi:MAG: DNRLRE domain-containing protein [Planctomycetota bacterium]